VTTTTGVVHIVGGDYLVFDAEVEEGEHVLSRTALKSIQILYLEVVFDELELETGSVRQQPFQVRFV